MTLWALAGTMAGAISVPHLLPMRSVAPGAAVALWLSALATRALLAASLVFLAIAYLPTTTLFAALSQWCWHAVLPLLTPHMRLDGHWLGDLAVLAPAVLVAASGASLLWGIFRAARLLRQLLRRGLQGAGPGGSTIVPGHQILLAATGLGRPQVLVSAGALTALDEDELAAGIEHERGHIARKHRFAYFLGAAFGAVARFLPGTRAATAELNLHLERDADAYAVARSHDPLALASAICKAIIPNVGLPAFALAGKSDTRIRLDALTQDGGLDARFPQRYAALALVMSTVTLALFTAAPIAAASELASPKQPPPSAHCPG